MGLQSVEQQSTKDVGQDPLVVKKLSSQLSYYERNFCEEAWKNSGFDGVWTQASQIQVGRH